MSIPGKSALFFSTRETKEEFIWREGEKEKGLGEMGRGETAVVI